MNVLVLGATGATGATSRLVGGSALAAGYAVTAFVREARRLPLSHPDLRLPPTWPIACCKSSLTRSPAGRTSRCGTDHGCDTW